ncbi:MAG: hypothetical protein ABEI99_07580 [Halobaculum sp.]
MPSTPGLADDTATACGVTDHAATSQSVEGHTASTGRRPPTHPSRLDGREPPTGRDR